MFLKRPCASSRTKNFGPFQMALLSNDFSQLPPIEMMDIFNHLIMGKTDNDKNTLSFWRSFKEYDICMNGHVQSLGVNGTKGLDGSIFFLFVAGVIPTQKEKTQEDDKLYRLWFVVDLTVFCILWVLGWSWSRMQTFRWIFIRTWWLS